MKKKQQKKPKVVIVSLTSCEGCQFALLDLGEKFFNFLNTIELLDFKLLEDQPFPKEKIDIAFVEGNPITEEEIDLVKKLRRQTKLFVVLGNCAALGGIPEMKNYRGKEKTIRYIYRKLKVANPEIKEIDNFVKVDFTIPGCPINGEEFLKLANKLVKGEIPKIPQNPVCSECPLRATPECFIVKKEICFGPVTLGGCSAVCPKNNYPCLGCRGFLKTTNVKAFIHGLQKIHSKKEILSALEIFGLRDTAENL